MKVYIKNQQRSIKVNPKRIKSLLRKALHLLKFQQAELSILFVNDRRMKLLNKEYRGVDKATDVLSFPQQESYKLRFKSYKVKNKKDSQKNLLLVTRQSSLILGDIVINMQRAKRQAVEQGITLNEELKRLLIHGLLHLMGYDHEKSRYQKNKMILKERELLSALNTLRERQI